MVTVPLDEGARSRRRVGAFWIEEGWGVLLAGGLVVAAVLGLYALAAIFDHP